MQERDAAEVARLTTAECESRRDDGMCNALGCKNGEKKIRCEWLARMATENCPKGHFGDARAAIQQQIREAVEAGTTTAS